jgi:hypothetical protein
VVTIRAGKNYHSEFHIFFTGRADILVRNGAKAS